MKRTFKVYGVRITLDGDPEPFLYGEAAPFGLPFGVSPKTVREGYGELGKGAKVVPLTVTWDDGIKKPRRTPG
jgi:hypothetical protein